MTAQVSAGRVSFNALLLSADGTGIRTLILGLLGGFKQIHPPEEFVVYLRQGLGADPELPRWRGCRYVEIPRTRSLVGRVAAELLLLSRYDRDLGVRVAYSPTSYLPLGQSVPAVATIVDLVWRLVPADVPIVRRLSLRFRMESSLTQAAGLVAISESVRGEALAAFGNRLKASIRVLPLGVDGRFFDVERNGVKRGETLILASGGTDSRKGVDTLLDAVAALPVSLARRIRLVVTGPREERRVEELLQRTDGWLRERIDFPGFVSIQELMHLFSQADLFVYPSRYEGFGLPVLEAMAAGIPVICSDLPVLREVGGDCVSYFPVGSAAGLAQRLLRVLTNEPIRANVVADGRAKAREYTWERTAGILLEVLRSVRGEMNPCPSSSSPLGREG